MKLSNYNIICKYGKDFIVHNMLNKSTIILNKKEMALYKSGNILNCDNASDLKDLGFIVNDEFDELKEALHLNEVSKNNYEYLNITLIPTFACNLNCEYCYQNGIKQNVISEDQQNVFIEFIKKRLIKYSSKSFHLSWFGGEPLLVFDIIKNINTQLKKFCSQNKIKFSSSIATNLTMLDDKMLKVLKGLNIT